MVYGLCFAWALKLMSAGSWLLAPGLRVIRNGHPMCDAMRGPHPMDMDPAICDRQSSGLQWHFSVFGLL